MMAFPTSSVTLRVCVVMQGLPQAPVFVLLIDFPSIGLEINSCEIAIYVPGGSFHFTPWGLGYLPMSAACPGKKL